MRSSFLTDLLSSIFERGALQREAGDRRSLDTLCDALLAERSEAAGARIANGILDQYEALDSDGRAAFFALLNTRYDIDPEQVAAAALAYRDNRNGQTYAALQSAAEPPRQEILRRLNRMTGATGRLVRMRAGLLDLLGENPEFRRTDLDFRHLFASWFNRGFLVLRRIDWTTPAHILEKIIEYEAVHAIGDWDDLRRRLQPDDRRCFAFFHPAMPDEPLIFVEVALTQAIPSSIGALLGGERQPIDDAMATTAVFYSISNCQKGLASVSFGNSLIKQVVSDLSVSLPNLKTFVTLSPVPGFTRWLRTISAEDAVPRHSNATAIASLLQVEDPMTLNAERETIARLAADYLVNGKRGDGQPLDAVTRFHLDNGARLEHIHPGANASSTAMRESLGVMVNYLYDPAKVDANHQAYAASRTVAMARSVQALAANSNRTASGSTGHVKHAV